MQCVELRTDAPPLGKNRGERCLCIANVNHVPVYVCIIKINYFVFLLTLSPAQFLGLYRNALTKKLAEMSVVSTLFFITSYYALEDSNTCSFILHWELLKPVCFLYDFL